ncbi:MAG: DNA repair protein RadC [Candidatus Iainarchaeum archaeon]|uniref:DNA repair protein RadC n=1 Tax=Candidatus Iainarchaeum sp. TaxID=3101447 RepID=A0A7T9DKB7_9ARCH|nr:MAG: DNA repair protein RadC [Candidatus Diapherotrites archaeon]
MRLAKWPLQLKPRERMEREGAHALSDVELIAILLRVGNRERNVVELAHSLLVAIEGDWAQLGNLSSMEWKELGVGRVQGIALKAVHEIGMRMQRSTRIPLELEEGIEWVRARIAPLTHEAFFVLPLDARDRLIGFPIEVSRGTRYQVLVEPRDVIAAVLKRGAKAFVVMHNHPSGETEPSSQDILLTKQIIEGAQWMGVELKDHFIVAPNKKEFSFREEDMLD